MLTREERRAIKRQTKNLSDTDPVSAGLIVDQGVDLWDVTVTGLIAAMGSMDDPVASWAAIKELRDHTRPFTLPLWWAAVVYPDRVGELVLPTESSGPHYVPSAPSTTLISDLAAAGLIPVDTAREWVEFLMSEDIDARCLVAADVVATAYRTSTGRMMELTASEQLRAVTDRQRVINVEVKVGGEIPAMDDVYLALVANLTSAMSEIATAVQATLTHLRENMPTAGAEGFVPRARAGYVSADDLDVELRDRLNDSVAMGITRATMAVRLVESLPDEGEEVATDAQTL